MTNRGGTGKRSADGPGRGSVGRADQCRAGARRSHEGGSADGAVGGPGGGPEGRGNTEADARD